MPRPVLAAVLLLGLAPGARAEVLLKGISWRLPRQGRASAVPAPLKAWSQPPNAKLSDHPLVAVVTLANRGPKSAVGVALRYAVSLRLKSRADGSGEGVWAVPSDVETRRVPRLKANEIREVLIDRMKLSIYLRQVHRAGYWADAVKLQVMVEPRGGESLESRMSESILPISWEEAKTPP